MSIQYFGKNERMSQGVVHNNTVYLAGQVASNSSGSMREQTDQILTGIDGLLAQANTDKSQLLSATIWITDMAEFSEMNAAWDSWVSTDCPPVRACVQATLAKPEWKVEIMVTAALLPTTS